MKNYFLTIAVLFCGSMLHAQDSIVVRKDPRLDVLTQKQVQINKRSSMLNANGQYKGFRIQVVSTTNREQALNVKSELLAKFPSEKTYLTFQSPYFKVRFGNYLKRDDAEKMRKQLNKLYPNGAFIVEDAIDYTPPLEEETTVQ
jgi:hypothetical protein